MFSCCHTKDGTECLVLGGKRREHQVGLKVGTLNLNTEPNPNKLNYRSIRVSGFEFGPDKFIIRSSTDRIT
jgi:hypothetical protein